MTRMTLTDSRIISARAMVAINRKQKRFTAPFLEDLANHTLTSESSPGVPLEVPQPPQEELVDEDSPITTPQPLGRLERLQRKLLSYLEGQQGTDTKE